VRDAGHEVVLVPDGPPVVHEGGAATAVAGGPPRASFLAGMVRYQRKHLGPVAGGVFAVLAVVGTLVRAGLEPPVLGLRAIVRRVRGRRDAASATLRAAGSWLALLEHDGRALRLCLARPRGTPPPTHPPS
jgi:hypothetical protein